MNPDHYKTLPIPAVPQTQALKSTTFCLPPLDGSLTVPEIYDWHLEHSPDHPLFEYAEDDGTVKTITWAEGVRAVHRAGRIVRSEMQNNHAQNSSSPVVIAILAAADFITYYTFLVGAVRGGFAAFFISPRNSPAAVAHLLAKTGAVHLFIGQEATSQELAIASLKLMETSASTSALPTSNMPVFERLYPSEVESDFELLPPYKASLDDTALLTHSSGSTAFPKPIRFTHYRYLLLCLAPHYGELDKTGLRMSSHSMPMYHGMGMIQTAWTASSGLVITVLKPQTPALPITAESVLKGATATKSDIIFCVPTFVEEWAQNPQDIRNLQRSQGIFFGGGPLSKQVGDFLTDRGVNIYNTYGIGECGILSPLFPKVTGKEWEYFEFTPNIKPHFIPDHNGYSEAFIVPNPSHVPNVLNATIDGVGAVYATSDWLAPHPTKPGYWKIIDRVDNQIIHSTGEKTNPGPLETMLNHDPHVQAAVMFGRGKFNAGVLIDPRPAFKFDPADTQKLAEFRNFVWPTVEKVNEYAPQHSRIFKEMIIVSTPTKPFSYTAKFTARRQAIIADYDSEIEALYASIEDTTQADLAPPSTWNFTDSKEFVRVVVGRVLKHDIGDTDDFFQKGCDSLQATWVRNSLLHALRDSSKVNTRELPTGFVYQHPTINSVAAYLSGLVNPKPMNGHAKVFSRKSAMLDMATKYSIDLRTPLSLPPQDVILLTGTTGGLGASLLATLVETTEVRCIYALNRSGRDIVSLVSRQRAVLEERGLDPDIVESPKVVLLEGDLSKADLSLQPDTLEQIRTSITHIIHNAYHVDWNVTLTSFDTHVRAVHNLAQLALSSPFRKTPRLVFLSSVAVLRHHADDNPIKEVPIPLDSAVGNGYSESKWVCEKILSTAAEQTSLRPIIIRLGQITGGSSGAWKKNEWVPSIIRTSTQLRALPMDDKTISWIPSDIAARSIVEMRNADVIVLHLAHPRPVSASTVFEPLSKALDIPLIPFTNWVALLEKKAATMEHHSESDITQQMPALKMMSFFRHAKSASSMSSTEAFGATKMDMSSALAVSETLRDAALPQLGERDALRWLEYWQRVGFM